MSIRLKTKRSVQLFMSRKSLVDKVVQLEINFVGTTYLGEKPALL